MTTATEDTFAAGRIGTELMFFARGLASTAPLSSALLAGLAAEIRSGGPVSGLLLSHPAANSPLFGVRALAGVNQLVLAGQAPQLAVRIHATVRAAADDTGRVAGDVWPLAREAMLTHPDHIVAALDRPVQQHLPNRAAELLRGLAAIGSPRIRLLEIGACAGLNLLFDRYHWLGPDWQWGDPRSGVRIPAQGPFPGHFEVVDRQGCDLNPLDPADPTDALILRSFVPAENTTELEQLDQALRIARQAKVPIQRASAAPWLADRLSKGTDPGVTTVIWHSLVWHYLDPAEQSAIERLLTEAATRMTIVRVQFEPANWASCPTLGVTTYLPDQADALPTSRGTSSGRCVRMR